MRVNNPHILVKRRLAKHVGVWYMRRNDEKYSERSSMKKTIIRSVVFVLAFIIALIAISNLMNKGNTDMTEEMSGASLPLIYMNIDGEQVNCLHGYVVQQDLSYERECISPMGEGRSISCRIEKYGRNIKNIFTQKLKC